MKHRQKVPCSICGKILKSITALRNHEEKHNFVNLSESEIKKLSCDLCGMRFRLKSYVFNHMHNVHLRNKYKCEICGMGFYKKYEQEEHVIRVHTKEKPIVCEYAGCGKAFARQKNYNIHKVQFWWW
jgi:Zinc finger, C2H2 type